MKVEIRYRWRVKSPAGRWFNTRHAASEETIRKQHPEAVAIEGSRTEQIILDQPAELLQARLHRYKPCPSVLIWPCEIPGQNGRILLLGEPSHYTIEQVGEEWVVMQNETVLVYRGPGPVRIQRAP